MFICASEKEGEGVGGEGEKKRGKKEEKWKTENQLFDLFLRRNFSGAVNSKKIVSNIIIVCFEIVHLLLNIVKFCMLLLKILLLKTVQKAVSTALKKTYVCQSKIFALFASSVLI